MHPTAPEAKPTTRSARLRALRMILSITIVLAACYVSCGFGRLWHDWRETRNVRPGDRADAALELLPTAGTWSFGDLDWDLRSQLVSPQEVAVRFAGAAAATTANVSGLPDLGPEFTDLLRNLRIEPIQHGPYQIYLLDRSGLKAQLVVRPVDGKSKAIGLLAAYPKDANQWQLFEFTPRSAAENKTATEAHLLPLPPGARRDGSRSTDDGRLLLELVTVETDADALVANWKQSGFDVRPTEFAGPDDLSYLCARGNDVIYAWSAGPRGSVQNLMLVRSPIRPDTQTQ